MIAWMFELAGMEQTALWCVITTPFLMLTLLYWKYRNDGTLLRYAHSCASGFQSPTTF
ncbi:hypothetical protein EJ08DRAFT_654771 [Tothia fuscella]|uniref:Uncharacterized protein n=1 Tax=Tothia fuscella TaxID=1048955 RepID=A0A9P4NE76_9PEZI|nr:hypothetical protein EJ08DRAFT_654771 [Tothia fuscella]